MGRTRSFWFSVALVLVVVTSGALAWPGFGYLQQSRDEPPGEVWPKSDVDVARLTPAGTGGESGSSFGVRVFISTPTKQLGIRTTYTPPPSATTPYPTATLHAEQEFSIRSYWPTTATRLDDNRILIAGKSTAGLTVLEAWTFASPSLSDAGALVPGSRTEVIRHYAEYAPGRDLVQVMVATRGAATSTVLVLFHDSMDICSFDLQTHSWTLLASPQGGAGALQVPALAQYNWGSFECLEHVTQGYVYVLRPKHGDVLEDGEVAGLLLFDADKNGTLDSAQTFTSTTWRAAGYGNSHSWVE
ncbi:MAG: hypothetical protein Q8K82_11220 [Gemmatimonadaceae bacterium]|nr:hypothetical protein [Gemmatimonadaceae bacterium]